MGDHDISVWVTIPIMTRSGGLEVGVRGIMVYIRMGDCVTYAVGEWGEEGELVREGLVWGGVMTIDHRCYVTDQHKHHRHEKTHLCFLPHPISTLYIINSLGVH